MNTTKVMFANFGDAECEAAMLTADRLRAAGISVMVYPESSKMKKQLGYADAMHIPYVAIIGESELADNKVTLKEMCTGNQESLSTEDLIERLR